MRVIAAVVQIVLCVATVTVARAADIPAGRSSHYSDGVPGLGQRSAQILIYDDQPGVGVRSYWSAPWHNHHYYPATGRRPGYGRAENLSAPREHLKPAPTFRRSWSNASAFAAERPREPVRNRQPAVPDELPPLK